VLAENCAVIAVCSNVVDLTVVASGVASDAEVYPSQVSHDCVSSSPPVYEHCGPPKSSSSERPVPRPRPRSTYGKYHDENVKNINSQSQPDDTNTPLNSKDTDNDYTSC